MDLSAADALALRMTSLLLCHAGGPAGIDRPTDVAGTVAWFGAMQAQDSGSALWSLGARLPNFSVGDVRAALENREALRTWPMRGTIHLVPPRDAHWMLELMGARPLAGSATRRAQLGLTEEVARRAVDVLGAALAGGGRLTRAQCLAALADAGIDPSGQLGYHLLWYASQLGVTCIAAHIGKEQTFVLLDEWVPDRHRPEREEALAMIALRYFRSHGPTTRQDFAGWTGLTATDAKRGIAAAGTDLATVRVDGAQMVLASALLNAYRGEPTPDITNDLVALPGFDEYLLGYKDRSLMVAAEHKQAIIPGGNGVFQPTIVRGGRVIATWQRPPASKRGLVQVQPLIRLREVDRKRIKEAFAPYGRFVGNPVELAWP